MKNLKNILIMVGIIILIGGIGGGGYYIYEILNYYTTDNAHVTADMVTITPEITGKLKDWNVQVGDQVKAGQILGRQDVSSMVSSTGMSPQNLSNSADTLVANADIQSPIDGKVVMANVVKGEVLTPGMEIAAVADTDHVYVTANVEETNVFHLKPGQRVAISIDAYPRRTFQGYVLSIDQATASVFNSSISLTTSNTYSKVTQLIPVHISIINPDKLNLMPGMSAEVTINIK